MAFIKNDRKNKGSSENTNLKLNWNFDGRRARTRSQEREENSSKYAKMSSNSSNFSQSDETAGACTRPQRSRRMPSYLRDDHELSSSQHAATIRSSTASNASDGAWFSQGETRAMNVEAASASADAASIIADTVNTNTDACASSEPELIEAVLPAAADFAEAEPIQAAPDRLKWGSMTGSKDISAKINAIHGTVTTWRPNLFEVPRGQAGKDFIAELTRLLRLFNTRSDWECVSLNNAIIFVPLMLQKPSAKSKPSDNARYLSKRLTLWKEGKLDDIMSEAAEIQNRMPASKPRAEEDKLRGFTRLMMTGKVKQALKLVDTENVIAGVHAINDDIRAILQSKHPEPTQAEERALSSDDAPSIEEVIFESIDGKAIQASAMKTFGSGGATKADADIWKHILCSKVFGKLSDDLAEEVAGLARRLCTEAIPHCAINLLFDGRLVALRKEDNRVRPIGIGETLRRIIGKSVAKVTGGDVQTAGGLLQTCTGLEAGIEAAIHAMARTWRDDSCEAVLLIDAENAFNSLNRAAALHNTKRKCPPLYQYLENSYQQPAKLHLGDGSFILSKEGVTQGDNEAMAMYAISTRGLQDDLKAAEPDVAQAWFADDNAAGAGIISLKSYWDTLNDIGPPYGFHPKASKCVLIIKDAAMREQAEAVFAGTGVRITTEGDRHIGAVLGSEAFKTRFVTAKVGKWVQDVAELAKIAEEEPQCALSAFNCGLSQRWSFLQRTVSGIGELFNPLEDAIRQQLIPALIGRHVSDLERRLLALPYRHGGLGIRNPTLTAQPEYDASCRVTEDLSALIYQQETDVSKLDTGAVKEKKSEVQTAKEALLKNETKEIAALLDEKQRKIFVCASEKGASSWLSALPLKKLGYVLNKQEFRDAICLRYGWQIPQTPTYCGCGSKNDFDHILTCKKGGYVSMRHNVLRDVQAAMLTKVCTDVRVEPSLLPTDEERTAGNNRSRSQIGHLCTRHLE